MKIGIIIENINLHAGIEHAVVSLANMLADEHSMNIISLYSSPNLPTGFQIDHNVSIIHMGYHLKKVQSSPKRYLYYMKLMHDLKSLSDREHFDVMIGTTHALNCILAVTHLPGIRKIGCEHFNYEMCPPFWRMIRRMCYPKLNDVVLLTKHDAKKYTFLHNTYVIPNSLPFTSDQVSDCHTKRIIAVGRLAHQKGFDLLLQVIHLIKDQMNGWTVEVFGEGEDKDMLLQMSTDLGVSSIVHFQGYVKDVKEQMIHSSIYIMASRFEGMPLVLLEAQSCGLPIISFDCKEGPSEIVEDGKSGYLVKTFDIKEMSEKLLELMGDEQKRIAFGKDAKLHSQIYSTENIKKLWLELLDK